MSTHSHFDPLDTGHITYESLLEGNRQWVQETLEETPDYFEKLATGQKPPVLWIGCSDSRVPANQITRTRPGEIFVHRNIANVVVNTDMNLLSVLDYSVNQLKVKHVIVCGHYGCGGVKASLGRKEVGIIDNWLLNIKEVFRANAEELQALDEDKRFDRLVELNAMEGVRRLANTTIIQNAWKSGQDLKLHAWAYSIKTGLINDLNTHYDKNDALDDVFRYM
ncbi:MAG: carbonate dehydratase [Mucilaginibacter polytrichastri]|nr:carbonate dehydratase [Mucilaginibacter polytrichastri]